uniref:Active breakpoint cluster region-related protein n=1 Tax=Timema cristinae TaxID=61476 RepID=A0A7R9C9X2_TIMCR|nr:unnamed protein product [Timema cristinae]
MSVFGDFRNVWVQRFPGSDLPAAWEEDVIANLAKHKQKVAVLREELEKEEFYVEYLERLLIDVAKHKNEPKDSEGKNSDELESKDAEKPKIGSRLSSEHSEITEGCANRDSDGEGRQKTTEHIEINSKDSLNQCISELSVSLPEHKISRSRSDVPNKNVDGTKVSDTKRPRSNTHPNISNYVTVIEVNGLSAKRGDNKDDTEKPTAVKKVPPIPPPKKFIRLGSSLSLLDGDIISKFEDKKSCSEEKKSGSVESIPEDSLDDKAESVLLEEEPYYDSVALDGEYVFLQSSGPGTGSTLTSNTSSGTTDTDPDTALTLPSNSPLRLSQSELTPTPASPGKQSNYVNIDYFIKCVNTNSVFALLCVNHNTPDCCACVSPNPSGCCACVSPDPSGCCACVSPNPSGCCACVSSNPSGCCACVSPDPSGYCVSMILNSLGCCACVIHSSLIAVHVQRTSAETRTSSVESEDEEVPPLLRTISVETEGADDLLSNLSYASSSSLESSTPSASRKTSSQEGNKAEAERITMYRCIIASIIESETVYLECLNVMLQYMKAIKATLTTSQPVITEEEFNTMFYKIPELYALHHNFLEGLKKRAHNWDGRLTIGDHFRIMCSANSHQFADITRDIRLKSLAGQTLSLEDLLHKPVARVQKNALVLHDLLKFTPDSHPDHQTLTEALKMTQHFLDEFNMIQTKTMFPMLSVLKYSVRFVSKSADRAQRRLVKNSFIVELADGHRKLRHLFFFNDVLACAKYKASGRDKFTFELKWYIPLCDIVIFEEPAVEPRETSPANIVALKSQACTVRDQILWDEKDDKRQRNRSEKQRKKLADLEAQLVLASPNLVFRVGNRSSRTYTFFLSSEFERTQWIEAIHALQSSQLPSPVVSVTMYELQAWITACRTFLKTNMGSYLLRTGRDESLLVGDLHLTLRDLVGLAQPADLFVCLEVDSYGHYFRKAKSKLVCNSATPRWNEEFIIEMEGSQNLRVLIYEESQDRAMLRGKYTQKLSRSWLSDQVVNRVIPFQSCSLNVSLKFVASEVTLRRVPTARSAGLFGAKIQQVCKRQKREIPFIITSCVREVERRGMNEVGVYRVSGSASDLGRLKKSFETNSYEAEQLLKEVDIHSVTGILKLYLRELPEALFTDELYPKFLESYNSGGEGGKEKALLHCFSLLSPQSQNIINYLLGHLFRVYSHEPQNKMSLHNLATVFGPTLLRPGSGKLESSKHKESLTASTVDVMAQAGILYFFLLRRAKNLES